MHKWAVEVTYAIIKKQAVVLEYETPYTLKQVVFGVFIDIQNDLKKCRLMFYDRKTLLPMYDDFNAPLTLTLQFEHIRKMERMMQFSYHPEVGVLDKAIRLLDKLRQYEGFKRIMDDNIVHDFQTIHFKDLTEMNVENEIPFESVILLNDGNIKMPILYWRLAYNLNEQEYQRVRKEWHPELNVKSYFKTLPPLAIEEVTIERLKELLKDGYTLEEGFENFTIKSTIKLRLKRRLNMFLSSDMNRPMRAYINQLTPRNLGRKTYRLPHVYENLKIPENFAAYTSLKHPVTLIDIDTTTDFERLINHLMVTSLLNHQTVLIVDPSHKIPQETKHLVLDMRTKESFNQSINALKSLQKQKTEIVNETISAIDYEEVYQDILQGYTWQDAVLMNREYKSALQKIDDFHLNVSLDMTLEALYQSSPITSLPFLNDIIVSEHALLKTIKQETQKNLQKLNLKAFKRLKDAINERDQNIRYSTMVKLFKSVANVHLIKQVFKTIIVKDTQRIPYRLNMFDQLMLIEPNHNHLIDLMYADKVTIIDERYQKHYLPYHYHELLPLSMIHAKHYHKPYHVYDALPDDIVKKHSFRKLGLPHHHYIPVNNQSEFINHVSDQEADSILKEIAVSEMTDTQIFTPFNLQKKHIKSKVEKNNACLISTFYDRPRRHYTAISLTVNPLTPNETYDWIKNHPELGELIASLEGTNMGLYADYNEIIKRTSAHDLLTDFVMALNHKKELRTDSINQFYSMFKSHLLKGYTFELNATSDLKNLRLPKGVTVLDTYDIHKLDQQLIIAKHPFTWTYDQIEHLKRRLREDHFALFTLLPSRYDAYLKWRKSMILSGLIYEKKR